MKLEDPTSCDWFDQRIDSYLDRDLSPEEEDKFMKHQEECSRCSRELMLAEKVVESLRSGPILKCPDRVIDRVLAEVASTEPGKSSRTNDRSWLDRWLLSGPWSAVAIPALAVLMLTVVFVRTQQQPPVSVRVVETPVKEEAQFSQEEIETARKQVRVAMAYLGRLGLKGIRVAGKEAIEEGILAPAEKTVVAMMDTHTMSFGKERRHLHGQNHP